MFQVALFESDPSGSQRLLGRTADHNIVETVRTHLVDRQMISLRSLGCDNEAEEGRDKRSGGSRNERHFGRLNSRRETDR